VGPLENACAVLIVLKPGWEKPSRDAAFPELDAPEDIPDQRDSIHP
jgi:hypothetical protein